METTTCRRSHDYYAQGRDDAEKIRTPHLSGHLTNQDTLSYPQVSVLERFYCPTCLMVFRNALEECHDRVVVAMGHAVMNRMENSDCVYSGVLYQQL